MEAVLFNEEHSAYHIGRKQSASIRDRATDRSNEVLALGPKSGRHSRCVQSNWKVSA